MTSAKAPPVLSTPAVHVLEDQQYLPSDNGASHLSDEELYIKYEIERTLTEIRNAKYSRVALQFPDNMLPDAPRVFEALRKGIHPTKQTPKQIDKEPSISDGVTTGLINLDVSLSGLPSVRYYILADTSYGACCVDEIAAEHVNADVVVHYGRACLSPTSRIPVIHIFTMQPLDQQRLSKDFQEFYNDKHLKIILMADVTYQVYLNVVQLLLEKAGYTNLSTTSIFHGPSSPLPNRTVPYEVKADPETLKNWHLFHISDPPESLLLTLASRVASIRIFPTSHNSQDTLREPFLASTSRALNKRYAILTSVATVSIFGILINTLSVKNYLHIVEHVKSQILAAGKKSYTFVVGRINAAKVANFSEIGAWVVIGCWESSLIDSKDFWKPVLTPFELELALESDEKRVWTGRWSSDFQKILDEPTQSYEKASEPKEDALEGEIDGADGSGFDSKPESAPPEFDLRTGRYVSHSRPMQKSTALAAHRSLGKNTDNNALITRAKGDLAVVGGELSPGAEHLRSKRTWAGLGSDIEIAYEEAGTVVEQGRSGIARGYTHGQDDVRT